MQMPQSTRRLAALSCLALLTLAMTPLAGQSQSTRWHGTPVELVTRMETDVDGAPRAYGPDESKALDYERNAHLGNHLYAPIVGYLKRHGRPVIQGSNDPAPGFYVSTTAFYDRSNPRIEDPRRYLDATQVNYVVLGRFGKRKGVRIGDLAAVSSARTGKSVFAIVGDSGNPSGAEGSLALLRALGYPFRDGKSESVEQREITIRFFPLSNPEKRFLNTQKKIDAYAARLGLSRDFPAASTR